MDPRPFGSDTILRFMNQLVEPKFELMQKVGHLHVLEHLLSRVDRQGLNGQKRAIIFYFNYEIQDLNQ